MNEDKKRNFMSSNAEWHDFPFDEVLSLETSLKKEISLALCDEMRRGGDKKSSSNNKSEGSLAPSKNRASLQKQSKLAGSKMTKKNRPPLLKCPTWPENQYSDGNSDNSVETFSSTMSEKSSISKLDSPSFYSVAAIDFSAISHLSEEHDKLMARENAEKSMNKHFYVSDSTKEKLYGKASQRRAIANGKTRQLMQKSEGLNDSLYSGSSVSMETLDSNQSPLQNYSEHSSDKKGAKNRKSSSTKGKRSSTKSELNSEKGGRKRFSSSPSVTVSSTPISSLQSDESPNTVLIESRPFPKSNDVVGVNTEEGVKNNSNVTAEKQPLPPEGFKISRYPLKNKTVDSSIDNNNKTDLDHNDKAASNNHNVDLDLEHLMVALQKQLKHAEEKVTKAEAEAQYWKENAEKTLRAVEVIKSQIEIQKAQQERILSKPSSESEPLISRSVAGRCSNENRSINNESNEVNQHFALDNETVLQFLRGNTKAEDKSCRKRTLIQEQAGSKRQCTVPVEAPMRLPSYEEDKNQSLLAWLANSEPEKDLDYLTFLEAPPNPNSNLPADLNVETNYQQSDFFTNNNEVAPRTSPNFGCRSQSHDDIKKAIREKVNINKHNKVFDETSFIENVTSDKLPLQMQNSLDRFLDSFTSFEKSPLYTADQSVVFYDDAKTPSSLPLQSPNIPSPLLNQSLSDSELHFNSAERTEMSIIEANKNEFFASSNSETDLSKVLDDNDLFSQLDSLLDL